MPHSLIRFTKLLTVLLSVIFGLNLTAIFAQTAPAATANQLELPVNDYKINFVWNADTLNAVWEPYAALLIPVKLPGCPKTFYMQFDLGARQSMLYTEKVSAIREKYPKSIAGGDSTLKLLNQPLIIGSQKIMAKSIALKKFSNKVINWKGKKSVDVIGTAGMDFIDNKTIVFDYPGRTLTIANSIPAELSTNLTLTKFMLVNKSILLPATILGKRTMLYFDTGSSAFELLTDKATSLALAVPNTPPVQYRSKSWDAVLITNTYTTNDSLSIAGKKLPIKKATYIDGASNSQVEQMMKLGMGGMTGNKLFISNILVIDTRNAQFGIISKR